MPPSTFALCFLTGAAAIALWLVHRYPTRQPRSFGRLVAHLVLANVGASATTSLLPWALARIGPVPALMLVAFPLLVYFFVASAWLLLYLQRLVTQLR